MKFTMSFLALFGTILLSFSFMSGVAAATSNTDIDQALFYKQNRQLVTVEITKPDNTKVDIDIPFLSIELEQNAYLGNPFLIGTSAQITHSAVSNFSITDITCALFDIDMKPVAFVTTDLQPISQNNTGVEIHAVGCGTTTGRDSPQRLHERYGCGLCCAGRIWTCVFSIFIVCPSSPSVC